MPLEAWMLRTVLVVLAINVVNIVLFWIARRWQGGFGAGGGPSAKVPPLSANDAAGWRQAPSDRAARFPPHVRARGSLRRGGLDFVRVMRDAVPQSAGAPLRTKSHAPGH
jgi:hypothetical protein